MGDVEYRRRMYQFELEDDAKDTKLLLDEYLGIDTIMNIFINLI